MQCQCTIAFIAHLIKWGSLSRIIFEISFLSCDVSLVKNRLMKLAVFRNLIGRIFWIGKYLPSLTYAGRWRESGTLEIKIRDAGGYILAISDAIIPPIDKPIKANGSWRFIFSAILREYWCKVSSFSGGIHSRKTASCFSGRRIFLNILPSAPSPLIKYTFN